jgi:hypothetical protein
VFSERRKQFIADEPFNGFIEIFVFECFFIFRNAVDLAMLKGDKSG